MELKRPTINQIQFYSKNDTRNTCSYNDLVIIDEEITKNKIITGIPLAQFYNTTYNNIYNIEIDTLPGTEIKLQYNSVINSDNTKSYKSSLIIIDHTGKYVLNCKNLLTLDSIGVTEKTLKIIDECNFAHFIVTLY